MVVPSVDQRTGSFLGESYDIELELTDSETPLIPQSSYGVEKSIMELYVYDYGRKGKPCRTKSSNGTRLPQHPYSTSTNRGDPIRSCKSESSTPPLIIAIHRGIFFHLWPNP